MVKGITNYSVRVYNLNFFFYQQHPFLAPDLHKLIFFNNFDPNTFCSISERKFKPFVIALFLWIWIIINYYYYFY